MADTQFHGLGTENAPADWTIPGSLELVVKAARAVYDGSSAAGAFYPCLEVLSDSGNVVGKYVAGSTVTAGDSADVSFGPFLEEAQPVSTGSTTVKWASYDGNSTTNLAVGNSFTFSVTALNPGYGEALLDLTTPTFPTVLADGWYRYTFGFDGNNQSSTTDPMMVYCNATQQFHMAGFGTVSFTYADTFVALASTHLTNPDWQMETAWQPTPAGDGFSFELWNYGPDPIDVTLDYVNVAYIDATFPA